MVYNNYHFRIPEGKMVRLIVNTDAKNEADDQYAIVHALLSPKFDNRGIIAAHFGNEKSPHSMEDSYDEVLKMLDLMDFPRDLAYKGADRRLPDEKTPVESQGARLIIEEAMKAVSYTHLTGKGSWAGRSPAREQQNIHSKERS